MEFRVFSLLEKAALRWKAQVAILEHDKKISFSELHNKSVRLSDELESLRLGKGQGIAFICRNGSRFVSGLFACANAGFVTMPVLPGTKAQEIEHYLEESSIALVLCEKDQPVTFLATHTKQNIGEDFVLYIFSGIESMNITSVYPGAAFIRPSSGTTGASKGVVISHEAVFERTAAANDGLKLDDTCCMLWVMPMAFHFVVSVILYVRYGTCMVVCDQFTAEEILINANRFKATHLYASPLHFRLLASENNNSKFEFLRSAISTSAQLESSVSKHFFEKYGIHVSQAYGIIEIGLPFINPQPSDQTDDSIGKVLPAYDFAILDENLNALPAGSEGAFAIRGPGMFSGYLWPVRKISDVLVNGWFLTGDIAEVNEEGYVFIRGRSKSMINVSGNKVFPEEVENVLLQHRDVAEARVYAGKHPVTGELVEAEIVLKPFASGDVEELIASCREQLHPYKVPQRIYFVKEIKKTKTGKIRRV